MADFDRSDSEETRHNKPVVLTICNHKGGTGKTTTVIHVAAALGLSGRRVLIVDLDPQGFLTRTLDVDEPAVEDSVLALFDPNLDPGRIDVRALSGFDLVPSSTRLTKFMRKLNKPTDVLWIRESIDDILPAYDAVIFDTAAAVTVYSLNALVASQHVLIPVLPEYQGVVGAEQTFQTTDLVRSRLNPGLATRSMLFTQVDARKRIHQNYQQYIRSKYGPTVLRSIVRTSTSLSEAHDDGTTIFDHAPTTRGARDYANATDELLHRMTHQADLWELPHQSGDATSVPEPGEISIPSNP